MLNKQTQIKKQNGFGIPELLIVFFVVAIIVVLALPRIISSHSWSQFAEAKKHLISMILSAQREATIQNTDITFRYDAINNKVIIYGGKFGGLNDFRNQMFEMDSDGLTSSNVIYGRPSMAPHIALGEGADLTPLTEGIVEVKFQSNGIVVDDENTPENKSLFFYNSKNPRETAFAISILGKEGQIKIWRYSSAVNDYIE
jgi:type II secretory pathway pseudopilin PulG